MAAFGAGCEGDGAGRRADVGGMLGIASDWSSPLRGVKLFSAYRLPLPHVRATCATGSVISRVTRSKCFILCPSLLADTWYATLPAFPSSSYHIEKKQDPVACVLQQAPDGLKGESGPQIGVGNTQAAPNVAASL